MSDMLLEVQSVSKSFGGLNALQEVSFGVTAGELVALIGPNGAGKSTMLNIVNGFLRASAGRILLGGRDITRAAVHDIARMPAVGRTFQKIRVFKGLTVLDNVRMAARSRVGVAGCALSQPEVRSTRAGVTGTGSSPGGAGGAVGTGG